MFRLEIKVNTLGATNLMRRAPGMLTRGTVDGLRNYLRGFHSRFRANRLSGRRGGVGLNRRSGSLYRGFVWGVQARTTLDSVRAFIGWRGGRSGMIANVHEYGALIRGKPWLTVPLPGVSGRASDYPGAFIIKSRRGNLLIVQKRGKEIQPLFVLKRSVRLKARLTLRATWSSSRERGIRRRDLGRAMRAQIGRR